MTEYFTDLLCSLTVFPPRSKDTRFLNCVYHESYKAIDLDGFSTNADGFFVLGNASIANADIVFNNNTLQNGADAVALYQLDATDFPNRTSVTADNLVNAIVYDTNDADDAGLLVLTPDSPQFNEDENNNKDT